MENEKLRISHSMVKTWRNCHRSYRYKYVDKLERKIKGLPLLRGSIIHECIDAWVNGKPYEEIIAGYEKKYRRTFAEEKAEYGDLPNDCRRILKSYTQLYRKEPKLYLPIGGKKCEFEFNVPLNDKIVLNGKIDGFLKDKSGKLWIVEHKTHKTIPTEEVRMSDIQSVIYCWVCEEMKIGKPAGILWDYIRTKPPAIPKLLKNGTLSKAVNIDCEPATFRLAIEKHGLDEDDYADIIAKLEMRNSFFRRVYLPVSQHMTKLVINDLRETGGEILRFGQKSKSRNLTMNCSWCDFFDLCQADLRGLDTKFLIKSQYQTRKRDEIKNSENEKTGL